MLLGVSVGEDGGTLTVKKTVDGGGGKGGRRMDAGMNVFEGLVMEWCRWMKVCACMGRHKCESNRDR